MNMNYYTNDVKAIVSDENGELKEVDNYDNINDVLSQENVIETITDTIDNLNAHKAEISKPKHKFNFGKKFGITLIAAPLIWGLINKFILGNPLPAVAFKFGTIVTPVLLSMGFAIIVGAAAIPFTIMNRIEKKMDANHVKGIEEAINYLTKKKEEEQAKLDDLLSKSTITVSNTPEIKRIVLHDVANLKDIMKYSFIYYRVGSKFNVFNQVYQDGKLDELLRSNNSLDELNDYVKVIEELGPQYVKEFKPNNKY